MQLGKGVEGDAVGEGGRGRCSWEKGVEGDVVGEGGRGRCSWGRG